MKQIIYALTVSLVVFSTAFAQTVRAPIVVAIMDSGVDSEATRRDGTKLAQYIDTDFSYNVSLQNAVLYDSRVDDGHGTIVAKTLLDAAADPLRIQVIAESGAFDLNNAGSATDVTDLIVSRLGEGSSKISDLLHQRGTRVVNISQGLNHNEARRKVADHFDNIQGTGWRKTEAQRSQYDDVVRDLFEANRKHYAQIIDANPDTVFVVAAGNDGVDLNTPTNEGYPALLGRDHDNVIVVTEAGTLRNGRRINQSNFGSGIVTTGIGGFRGTSLAAPKVAAAVADMLTTNANLKPGEIKAIIENTNWCPSGGDCSAFGGTFHRERALKAAELSQTISLAEAIARANATFERPPQQRQHRG